MKKEKISIQDVAVRWISDKRESDFSYLYTNLNPRVKSFLWKVFFSHSFNSNSVEEVQKDIDDIIANAWVRVFNSSCKYDPTYQFTTWLFTIAKNEARNFFKNRNRYSGFSNFTGDDGDANNGIDHLMFKKGMFDTHRDHNIEIELDKLYTDVMEDIVTSPKNTSILIDREVNKMSYSDIALKHEVNESTSKVVVHRNRKFLKRKYENRYTHIINNQI